MAKEIRVHLEGSIRRIEPDSFKDKEGRMVHMTRVKILTGSIDTDDEQIYDINYMWKEEGTSGPVRPSFLKDVVKGKVARIPVRIVAVGNQVEVKGV